MEKIKNICNNHFPEQQKLAHYKSNILQFLKKEMYEVTTIELTKKRTMKIITTYVANNLKNK